jgi:hypothetical protein
MGFREVWQKIGELEGQSFRTGRGEEFSYRFRKTYVVVSLGGISIPRTNFEKIFKRIEHGPETGNETAATAVQGQRLITAILRGAGIATAMD